MSLTPGTRLGPYEIVSAIGAGGMGEVYRAKDIKLNRDVAIKVLPESFALDADRVARFTREAQVLASLNHPNIAAIYGIEESGSTRALVMELVDGEDLSAHIARGALPLAESLPMAKQIADALEAAHEQGIIHRDLKPQNIKVRTDGTVKVLDFGLAKAMDATDTSAGSAMNSPTMTARMTQMGMILGTAAYMAPEQAKGKPVDRRADIWAFGVVLHEMLTGGHLFLAETIPETLAHVMTRKIDLGTMPASTPRRVRDLLARCLEKDPKKRLRDIGEARLVLDDPTVLEPDVTPSSSVMVAPPVPIAPLWKRLLPWAVAAVGVGSALVLLSLWAPWRTQLTPAPRRLLAGIGADASLDTGVGPSAILSPDGTMLAFVAKQGGAARLFVRKLDQLQATALAGTDGAFNPFFSPNGQWIAFFDGTALKKVSVTGGALVQLCEAPSGRGGAWADDDTIYFTPSNTTNVTIMRVPSAGGKAVAAGVLSAGATTQRWPQVLPGGAGVLFSEHASTSGWDSGNVVVMPLQGSSAEASAKAGGAPKVVVRGGYFGRYVAAPKRPGDAGGGYLLYVQQGTVFGVPFDLTRLETTGQAVPVVDGVTANTSNGGVQLQVAPDGTLVYVPGTATSATNPIDWVMRDGKTSPLRAAKADWNNVRFSPDGQRVAMDISDGKQRDIWVYEWSRDTLTQLTFNANDNRVPVWTPDGRRIVFASDRAKKGISNVYWMNADGTGDVTRLTDSPAGQTPQSWHPSGKFLTFHQNNSAATPSTSYDLMILPMDGDAVRGWTPGKPTTFLATPATEVFDIFSPDGRWIAYESNEHAGVYDIYVRPFQGQGGPWRISMDGGLFPRWSKAANELLFFNNGKIYFAPFTVVGDSFRVDKPQAWTSTAVRNLSTQYPYDIHPDGKRLAAIANVEQNTTTLDKVVFVFNFFDYLKSTVPAGKR